MNAGMAAMLQEDVKEGMTIRFLASPTNERFIITRKAGELVAKKLVTFHSRNDGTEPSLTYARNPMVPKG
jgi:hypothetical protein